MKYTLLSWVLLAFTNVLAAVDSGDAKFMVVHDVKVAFDKSRRDIEVITFNVFNVQEGKGFTCTSTKMPYYPMTPDFETCTLVPVGLGPEPNKIEISFGVEPPTVRLTEDLKLNTQLSMLIKSKDPSNGNIWFARYKSNEDTNELEEHDEYYIVQTEPEIVEEYRGPSSSYTGSDTINQITNGDTAE